MSLNDEKKSLHLKQRTELLNALDSAINQVGLEYVAFALINQKIVVNNYQVTTFVQYALSTIEQKAA